MAEIDYRFISELPQVEQSQAGDLFVVSQLSGNYDYLSKSLTYGQLSTDFTRDLDNKIRGIIDADMAGLCAQVYKNRDDISVLQDQMEQVITAIIKMANCIQYNKKCIQRIAQALSCEHGIANLLDLDKEIYYGDKTE